MICDISLLADDFKPIVTSLLSNCLKQGIVMVPSETIRSPFLQAKYWCQSRSVSEIDTAITELRQKKANFLVSCIEAVGPIEGPKITNALPGYSWHQWGEALDCFWQVNGKANWDCDMLVNGLNGYQVYAAEAKKLGLDAGFFWTSIKDAPHVQYREAGSPSVLYSLREINDIMEQIYA